jgi:hypothetical protein
VKRLRVPQAVLAALRTRYVPERVIRVALVAFAAATITAGCGGGESSGGLPSSFVVVRSQDNPTVPSTGTFTELLRLTLEPGSYEVTGKVELHNRDALPYNAQCELVPSNPDGSAGELGGLGSDAGFRHLGPTGEPGELSGVVLFVSQELEQAGSVVLGCSGVGGENGAFAAYTSIRAIQVGSIESRHVTP